MRTIDFRFVILRNGSDYCLLQQLISSPPTLRMNESGIIKTSLSAEFLATVLNFDGEEDPELAVNWLNDEIRAEMIIDGIVHPLGVFVPSTILTKQTKTGTTLQVEAYDRCWYIKDHYTTGTRYFAAGVNYITAITQLLTECGITLISQTPTNATLTEAREDWTIGTSYLTIINQLLSEINYNPLWFDSSGLAILEPASIASADAIDRMIDIEDPASLGFPEMRRTTDIFNAPNVFICICSNAEKASMVATAENLNPQSALSIPRRNRRIQSVTYVDNIASQTELQAYANRLRDKSMITSETIMLTTELLPGFGVGDVIGLRNGDEMSLCIERSWSMSLTPGGKMQHTLEKVVLQIG